MLLLFLEREGEREPGPFDAFLKCAVGCSSSSSLLNQKKEEEKRWKKITRSSPLSVSLFLSLSFFIFLLLQRGRDSSAGEQETVFWQVRWASAKAEKSTAEGGTRKKKSCGFVQSVVVVFPPPLLLLTPHVARSLVTAASSSSLATETTGRFTFANE